MKLWNCDKTSILCNHPVTLHSHVTVECWLWLNHPETSCQGVLLVNDWEDRIEFAALSLANKNTRKNCCSLGRHMATQHQAVFKPCSLLGLNLMYCSYISVSVQCALILGRQTQRCHGKIRRKNWGRQKLEKAKEIRSSTHCHGILVLKLSI